MKNIPGFGKKKGDKKDSDDDHADGEKDPDGVVTTNEEPKKSKKDKKDNEVAKQMRSDDYLIHIYIEETK